MMESYLPAGQSLAGGQGQHFVVWYRFITLHSATSLCVLTVSTDQIQRGHAQVYG
jgi:hypothetical protein